MIKSYSILSVHVKQYSQGKLCFTQFGTINYRNISLAASDIFPMFTQSINFYTSYLSHN